MTEIPDRLKQREHWVNLLNAAWMYHEQLVKETAPEILGDAGSDDHLFHKALSVAIMDAIELIQQVEALGYFDEVEEELSKPGPAG